MTITIRKMQPADYAQVIELLSHWNLAPIVPSADITDPERTEFIVENALVAVDGERIVGVDSFIQHSPTLAEGASFAVDPDYRGQRIGKMLADALRRLMYARGIRTLRSEADRPEVIRWLIQRGLRVLGTVPKRHAFGSPDVDHWTVLELDLDSVAELRDLHSG